MRILLADDDRITRLRLEAYLRDWGHEVLSAADGEQAWSMFQEQAPWLVISDWQMPGMDGLELVRAIRQSAQPGGYVYTILLTSRSAKTDLVVGMEAGADDFIAKPFDKGELRVRIRAGERVVRLERELAERNTELTTVNDRMRESLKAAARIQQAFLPKPETTFEGLRAAWCYLPCEELAGDTLNILALDAQHVCFYIADVCGHGVASSLLSVMLSRLLSSGTGGEGVLVRHNPADDSVEIVPPAEVVRNLNERFPWNPEAMEYFTIFYGIYNSAARELSYVCAGHPPPILVPPSGPPSRLVADPPAVGLLPNAEFPEHRLQLAPGDRVFAFTDGIVESLGTADEEFGEARLVASVSAPRLADLPGSISAVIQDVDAWRAGADPADDQCIIGVEAQ